MYVLKHRIDNIFNNYESYTKRLKHYYHSATIATIEKNTEVFIMQRRYEISDEQKGILLKVFEYLKKDSDYENLSIDSTTVKAHQSSVGAKRGSRTVYRQKFKWKDNQDTCVHIMINADLFMNFIYLGCIIILLK